MPMVALRRFRHGPRMYGPDLPDTLVFPHTDELRPHVLRRMERTGFLLFVNSDEVERREAARLERWGGTSEARRAHLVANAEAEGLEALVPPEAPQEPQEGTRGPQGAQDPPDGGEDRHITTGDAAGVSREEAGGSEGASAEVQPALSTLEEVFGHTTAQLLSDAGMTSVEVVAAASDEDLLTVQGVGPATVKGIREALTGE